MMKLKTKIQLFSSLFMLILIGLVNTSIYFLFYHISLDSELDLLLNETNTIVETFNNHSNIPQQQLLTAFVPENGIIRIIDETGTEKIPTLTKRRSFTELPYEYVNYDKTEIQQNKEGNIIAVVYKPIIWQDGTIVTLQVANYLFHIEEMLQTLLFVLLAASFIILIPTIIAGNLLTRFMLQPIQKLISAMRGNMKEENWQTIELKNKSKDELYEMGKTFNEMIEHLKESFQRQEDFVSDASHELKTPISIIKSYAELLERRYKTHPEVISEAIEAIQSEANRMQHLVNQLLALARNKQLFPHKKVNIVPLIDKVTRTFQEAYDRTIDVEIKKKPVYVKGNKEQIEQVLYIVLTNAVTYSYKKVTVELIIQNEHVRIEVTDDGPGISVEDQKRIFDRFYRVDKARARSSGGTGLGLAIAKQIIEAHDGKIEVESELNKGASFIMLLPVL